MLVVVGRDVLAERRDFWGLGNTDGRGVLKYVYPLGASHRPRVIVVQWHGRPCSLGWSECTRIDGLMGGSDEIDWWRIARDCCQTRTVRDMH